MSNPIRIPGPVDDEAKPIDSSSPAEESTPKSPVAAELFHKSTLINDSDRKPGPVDDPAEGITEAEKSNPEADEAVSLEVSQSSPWKAVFWMLALTVFCWLLYEVGLTVFNALQQSLWFGLPLALLTAVLLALFGRAVARELQALRGVDQLAMRDERMRQALASKDLCGLREILEPTLNNLRNRQPGLISEFDAAAAHRESPEDYLKLFDHIVLTQLDNEVDAVIKRSALTGSVSVAVLPHPALDAAVLLWRAKLLIQKVGEIYGLEPTGLSSLRLMKHAITSSILAAGIESSGEVMLTQMAQDTFVKALKPLAEGGTAAIRLYRLGKMTRKVCRPSLTPDNETRS